jgi:hypothetical protein
MSPIPFRKSLLAGLLLTAVTVHADTPAPAANDVSLKLTAPDMVTRVSSTHTQMEGDLQHVSQLQARVRLQKDAIKLSCVNGKLVEMKAQMNVFDTTELTFEANLATGVDGARSSLGDLLRIGAQVKSLRTDADGCIGVPELAKQESGAEVEHPEFPDDPSMVPVYAYIEPPVYASPFN